MTPPKKLNLIQKALLAFIRGYQLILSPWIGNQCRFYPTCSEYGREAIEVHGAFAGTWLTLKRISRCHPLCKGGFDPVPERDKKGEKNNKC